MILEIIIALSAIGVLGMGGFGLMFIIPERERSEQFQLAHLMFLVLAEAGLLIALVTLIVRLAR